MLSQSNLMILSKRKANNVKKSIVLMLIVLMVSALISGCGKKEASTVGENAGPKFVDGKLTQEFQLKVPDQMLFDFTIAKEKGYLSEVGIVPQNTGVLPTGTTLVQTLISGQNDLMGSGHVTDIVNARKAGAKIKIVMEGHIDSPDPDKGHMYLFVRDDGKINSAQDLIGKKIAVAGLGTCAELMVDEYLRQNGIGRDKVELIVMKDLQQEQSLRQGQIDAAFLHVLYAVNARTRPGLKQLVSSYEIGAADGHGDAVGLAVRAFSEDFINKYPDVVKAYIVANHRAQQWANNNFTEAAAIYARINEVQYGGGNLFPDDVGVDEAKIQYWLDVMERNGWIKPGEINAKDLYTNDLNPFLSGEVKE